MDRRSQKRLPKPENRRISHHSRISKITQRFCAWRKRSQLSQGGDWRQLSTVQARVFLQPHACPNLIRSFYTACDLGIHHFMKYDHHYWKFGPLTLRKELPPMRHFPRVALLLDSARKFDAGLLRGIARYVNLHQPREFLRPAAFCQRISGLVEAPSLGHRCAGSPNCPSRSESSPATTNVRVARI